MDKAQRKMYSDSKGYIVTSAFHVTFGIVGSEPCDALPGTCLTHCRPFPVGTSNCDILQLRLYDRDDILYPADKRVIQCIIGQSASDYEFRQKLYDDKGAYNAEKKRISDEIATRIYEKYPTLKDRLVFLDAYSPVSLNRRFGAYKGAYMSVFSAKGRKILPQRILSREYLTYLSAVNG